MSAWLQVIYGGLTIGAIYALVALGFSLIYRTIGLVNFSQGGLLMFGAYVGAILLARSRTSLPRRDRRGDHRHRCVWGSRWSGSFVRSNEATS